MGKNADKSIKNIYEEIDFLFEEVSNSRESIVKLVKQVNKLTSTIRHIQDVQEELISEFNYEQPLLDKKSKKEMNVDEVIVEFLNKQKNLKELEKILEKYKDQITPGQVGES